MSTTKYKFLISTTYKYKTLKSPWIVNTKVSLRVNRPTLSFYRHTQESYGPPFTQINTPKN